VLQCIVVCCSVLQCSACKSLSVFASAPDVYVCQDCNTLHHDATQSHVLQHTHVHREGMHSGSVVMTATHCNTLQHTATHCNTLQHTAMYYLASSVAYANVHEIADTYMHMYRYFHMYVHTSELIAAAQRLVRVLQCVVVCVAVFCSVLQ